MDLLEKFRAHLAAECGLSHETVIAYTRDVERFLAWAGSARPAGEKFSAALADAYLTAVADRFAPRTRQRKRIAIKRFYQVLAQTGRVAPTEHEVIAPIRVGQQAVLPILTGEQVQRVLERIRGPCALRDRAIVALLFASGLRASEVRGMQVEDVKWADRAVRVRGKGGVDRVVPTTDACLAALSAYANVWRPRFASGCVVNFFITQRGRALHRRYVSDIVARATVRAGVPRGTAHTLRRTCGTTLLRNGAPIQIVQRVLGHANLRDTQRYVQLAGSEIFQTVRRFHPAYHPTLTQSAWPCFPSG